jgi:hypothetical protein
MECKCSPGLLPCPEHDPEDVLDLVISQKVRYKYEGLGVKRDEPLMDL